MTANENALIEKARNGEVEAFERLVVMHEHYVYNLALRTLGNAEDAADVAQEAFVRAWLSLGTFRQQAQLRTWLYRIVLNLCLNRLPRLRRDLNALTQDEIFELPETPHENANPEERLEAKEQGERLHGAIDRLPEQYRLLITLRYTDELSYEEIANLIGLPVGTVKTGLFRAKARLREALLAFEEKTVCTLK